MFKHWVIGHRSYPVRQIGPDGSLEVTAGVIMHLHQVVRLLLAYDADQRLFVVDCPGLPYEKQMAQSASLPKFEDAMVQLAELTEQTAARIDQINEASAEKYAASRCADQKFYDFFTRLRNTPLP